MAVFRGFPYRNQHFRVDLCDGSTGPAAAFSEVLLPSISIDVVELRNGNASDSGLQKSPGPARYSDVTLRRGFGPLDAAGALEELVLSIDRVEID